MSEYRYNLTISGGSSEELKGVIHDLTREGIIPNLLRVDMLDKNLGTNLYCADLSTEGIRPYGTISCWAPSEHEKLFNGLSLKNPGLMFEFTGEDIDEPNNGIFMKAFQNGLYKEVYQEKQDISEMLNRSPWRQYGAPEHETQKGEVWVLFETLFSLRNNVNFQVAYDMAYMQEYIELDNPLTSGELFTLATKLQESSSWFGEPLLHEEHLDAIRYMLEYGFNKNHEPDFPYLSADDARKLLLSVDNQVFGSLVEVTAIRNQEANSPINFNHYEEIKAIVPAIEAIQEKKDSLDNKIAAAQEIASYQQGEQGKSLAQAGHEF